MENIRSTATSKGSLINEWEIHRNVTGEPSHGRVLGLGTGVKEKDVYGSSSSQTCSKNVKKIKKGKKRNGRGVSRKWNPLLINCSSKYLPWFKQYCKAWAYLMHQ